METYKQDLQQWAKSIQDFYQSYEVTIIEVLGKERTVSFSEWLVNFTNALQDEARIEETELYEQASRLHQQWKTIWEAIQDKSSSIERNEIAYQPVPIGKHTLPPMPYSYNALEPYIAEEIMRLHHTKHHQSYVDGLNEAEKEMEKARKKSDFELIKHWQREAAFNGAGHYLHTIFWNVMSPRGGGEPTGNIAQQIRKDFGSFRKFKEHFSEAAKNVEAVGWAILVWTPRSHRLEILQAEKHQNLSQWDVIPLLVLDVWEHAYYLQYKNERGRYVDNWWNVVCWEHVNKRFENAKELKWHPY